MILEAIHIAYILSYDFNFFITDWEEKEEL